jgi:hypothetical protein
MQFEIRETLKRDDVKGIQLYEIVGKNGSAA